MRRGSKKLLLSGAALLAGLLIAELVVRLGGQAPEIIPIGLRSEQHVYRRSENPILSYEFKPGFRSEAPDLRHDYRYINAHGFRDVERSWEKAPGTKRVILLGDSVVVGYKLPEIEQLMSRQLEKRFAGTVEVLNLAVTGYCTRAEIELLRVYGLRYQPDAVILVFVENDFRNFNPEALGADGLPDRPALVEGLFRNSALFRTASVRLNAFGFGQEGDPARWNREAIGDNNVPEGLRLFRALAEAQGFRPLVVAWPTFAQDGIDYAKKMVLPGSGSLIIEQLCARYGLPMVGLREAFLADWQARSPRPSPQRYYTIGDQMHASAEGHRVAAEILHRLIEEQRLLEPGTLPAPRASDDGAAEAARALGSEPANYGTLHYNQAVDHFQAGALTEALNALDHITEADELNHANACSMRGVIFLQRGQLEAAEAQARRALKSEPAQFQAHLVLAGALEQGQRWEEALAVLQRALAIKPDSLQVSNGLARALLRLDRPQEAHKQYRHSLTLEHRDLEARQALGNTDP